MASTTWAACSRPTPRKPALLECDRSYRELIPGLVLVVELLLGLDQMWLAQGEHSSVTELL